MIEILSVGFSGVCFSITASAGRQATEVLLAGLAEMLSFSRAKVWAISYNL